MELMQCLKECPSLSLLQLEQHDLAAAESLRSAFTKVHPATSTSSVS